MSLPFNADQKKRNNEIFYSDSTQNYSTKVKMYTLLFSVHTDNVETYLEIKRKGAKEIVCLGKCGRRQQVNRTTGDSCRQLLGILDVYSLQAI
jgi:hypothetical protein